MGSQPSRVVGEPVVVPQLSNSFSACTQESVKRRKSLSSGSASSLPRHHLMVATSNSVSDLSQQVSPSFDTGRPGSAAKYQRIRVRCCTGEVLNLDVRPTISLSGLKVKIARHLLATAGYYPPSSMRLVFNSKVLPEVGTLLSLQICDGSRVVMATVRDAAGQRNKRDIEANDLEEIEKRLVHQHRRNSGAGMRMLSNKVTPVPPVPNLDDDSTSDEDNVSEVSTSPGWRARALDGVSGIARQVGRVSRGGRQARSSMGSGDLSEVSPNHLRSIGHSVQ